MILLASQGLSDSQIAEHLGCSRKTVGMWRRRFKECPRVRTLKDMRRPGRPPSIPLAVRLEIVKLACDRPEKKRFRDIWTIASLKQAVEEKLGFVVSATEIRRILRDEEIRPHRVRMWVHSPDPHFRSKVRTICNVYLHHSPDETVLCIDEKTGMQALERKHSTKPPGPGRIARREFEYIRHGTRTLFAAFNPHTGDVFGQVSVNRSADTLLLFMERVAQRYPTGQITIVWDNLNTHHGPRWEEFNRRHGGRFRFLYTPLHASWVNQVEIWFSILSRRVLKHGDFTSAQQLERRVRQFIAHWNEHEAHPFRWTFRGNFRRKRAA
jgi:transposase